MIKVRAMEHLAIICILVLCLASVKTRAAEKHHNSLDLIWNIIMDGTRGADDSTSSSESSQQQPHQPIKVIGAGLPRTGTSSFRVAMEKLGLNMYHMKEGVIETPGHIDLWYKHYVENNVTFDEILDDISARGFNATADAPMSFWYKEQMERYPDAKVVLNVRGDGNGEAWMRSITGSIFQSFLVIRQVPFCWIPGFQKFDMFHQVMIQELGTDTDPTTQLPVIDQLPRAYERWVERVKKTVPEHKLLVHAAQDGWAPLCEFLSPLSPDIKFKCDAILASGEPYPRVNERAEMQRVMNVNRGVTLVFKVLPIFLLGLVVATLLIRKKHGGVIAAKAKAS